MAEKRDVAPIRSAAVRDPFTALRQLASEFERVFDHPFGASLRWPSLRTRAVQDGESWVPQIDVFERDNRLVTKVDLPGLKKEDVKVEVLDGRLAISGERRSESEEEKDNIYRSERSYGSFYRAVPLPEEARLDEVKATFANGVLEVSVPMPARAQQAPRTIAIEEPAKSGKSAAA